MKHVIKLVWLFLIIWLPAKGFCQDSNNNNHYASILSVDFSPSDFVPGTSVTAFIKLLAKPGSFYKEKLVFDILAAGDFNNSEDEAFKPSIVSATLDGNSKEVSLSIVFIPWKAGPSSLPEFTIGGLLVPQIKIESHSSLADGVYTEPLPLAQLEPPGLLLKLYILGAVCIILLVLSALFWLKFLPAFKVFLKKTGFKRIRKKFNFILKGLSGNDAKSWALLCNALRDFSEKRLALGLKAMTATEIRKLKSETIPEAIFLELSYILALGDMVRYGGKTGQDAGKAADKAMALADIIDAALKALK